MPAKGEKGPTQPPQRGGAIEATPDFQLNFL
jgi:hypothetical protein